MKYVDKLLSKLVVPFFIFAIFTAVATIIRTGINTWYWILG